MTFGGIVFDLDGTLTPVRSSWRYIHERLGLWRDRADDHQRLFEAGRISYEEFCRLDAAHWRGLPAARLAAIAAEITCRPGIEELTARVRAAGLKAAIVSTGLTILADRIRGEQGFDFARANHLEIVEGRLSGRVEIRVTHGRKDRAVAAFLREFGLERSGLIAVGDSEGDISMFEAAGHAIAFNPSTPELARHAACVCEGESLAELARCLPVSAAARTAG